MVMGLQEQTHTHTYIFYFTTTHLQKIHRWIEKNSISRR